MIACHGDPDGCLEMILRTGANPIPDTEVLIVVPGRETAMRFGPLVPSWMRVIAAPDGVSLVDLRRMGVDLASGDVVRLLDAQAFLREAGWSGPPEAAPDWENLLTATGAPRPSPPV